MVYQYGTGNRLQKVTDYSLATKGFKYTPYRGTAPDFPEDYTYDANGNLKTDRHKKILGIDYNYLNLPMVIRLEAGTLEFVYDATGAKLRKVVKNGQGVVTATYDYVNGVEYKDRILQRVAHSEGAVVRNDNGFYQHEYVLRDHLGNTRVTFRDGTNQGTYFDWTTWSDRNIDPNYDDGVVTTADIVQENHYYPFGMNLEGNWNGAAGNNKYQYNGKEWNDDFGLGWNDYGARFYDPAIARWNAADPLAEKYLLISPYVYVANNPLIFIDPTGKELQFVLHNKEDKATLQTWLDKGLGDYYKAKIDEKGVVTLTAVEGMNINDAPDQVKGFYETTQEAIGANGTVKIDVLNGSDEVVIGSFEKSAIDIADLKAVENMTNKTGEPAAVTVQSKLAHEISEQTDKQINKNNDFKSAHTNKAIPAEDKVSGSKRGEDKKEMVGKGFTVRPTEYTVNGKKVIVTVTQDDAQKKTTVKQTNPPPPRN